MISQIENECIDALRPRSPHYAGEFEFEKSTITLDDTQQALIMRVFFCLRSYHKKKIAIKLRQCMTRWIFCSQQSRASERKECKLNNDTNQKHREKFLAAFRDQEAFRSKMKVDGDVFRQKMYQLTNLGGARMLVTFWKCRLLRTMGIAFQRWFLNLEHAVNIKKIENMRRDIIGGEEELGDRKKKIKDIDELNSRLQLSLLVVLSVLRLRAHSFLVSLSSSRKQDAKERTKLFNELLAMKRALAKYDAEDERAMSTAQLRGEDHIRALNSVKVNLNQALRTHTALKQESDEMNEKQRYLHNQQEKMEQHLLSRGNHLESATPPLSNEHESEQPQEQRLDQKQFGVQSGEA